MTVTCLGCAFYERVKVRCQHFQMCRYSGKLIPLKTCAAFVPRFGEAEYKVEPRKAMPVELL